ncbi:DUF2087 domain-containing protein [Kitasatospora sp. NPDC088351]|uniref:DUF2087 domain-containing protein n=1 Tax=unclassified Kitasatospora TaxID=2633591 RepID=UPI003434691D
MTPEELTLVLSDPTLRRVFAAVALGSETSSEILGASGLATPEAAKAIGQLVRAGVLTQGRGRLTLDGDALATAAATAAARQEEQAAAEQPDPRLRGFVRGDVLVRLPEEGDEARPAVLRHVAETAFERAEEYDERTVTDRLEPWCADGAPDAVSLRRSLVDAGALQRDAGRYRLATPVDGTQP